MANIKMLEKLETALRKTSDIEIVKTMHEGLEPIYAFYAIAILELTKEDVIETDIDLLNLFFATIVLEVTKKEYLYIFGNKETSDYTGWHNNWPMFSGDDHLTKADRIQFIIRKYKS